MSEDTMEVPVAIISAMQDDIAEMQEQIRELHELAMYVKTVAPEFLRSLNESPLGRMLGGMAGMPT